MRRPTSAIVTTVCLLAAWIATPLLSVAHVVLVEHRFCAEHERLEEGADGHASGTEEGYSDVGESSRVSPGHAEESRVEHEGCAFGENFTLEDHFVLPLALVAEPAFASEASQVLRTGTVAASVPLLLVAPKSSPPLIA